MDALTFKRENEARRTGVALGIDTTHPRITEAAVQGATAESNIEALPPSLDMPPAMTEDGASVFVLGLSSLDSEDVIL